MKKIIFPALLFTIFILVINYSCKKEEIHSDELQEGQLELSIRLSESILDGTLKSIEEPGVHSVVISITDKNDKVFYEKEKILLLNMNGYYISKPLSLPVGDYQLTEFIIVDEENNVLYITPKEGSPKAYLIDDPLPLNFTIEKDEVTKLVPEVLSVGSGSPADFGYSTFSFSVVETFDFLLGIFIYDDIIQNFKLTEAKLRISNGTEQLFYDDLKAITNQITLRDNFAECTIEITKQGYLPFKDKITADKLKSYTSDNAGPMIITLEKRSTEIKKGSVILWWNGSKENFGTLDTEAEQIITLGNVGKLAWWSVSGPCAVIDDKLYAVGMNAGDSPEDMKLYSCDVNTGVFLNEKAIGDINHSFAGIYNNQIVTVWWDGVSEKFGLLDPASGDVNVLGEVGNMKFWQIHNPSAVIGDKLVVFGFENTSQFADPNHAYICDLKTGEFIKNLQVPVQEVVVAGIYKEKLVITWKSGSDNMFGFLDIETGTIDELGILENVKCWQASRPCTVIEDKLSIIGFSGLPELGDFSTKVYIYSLETGKYIKDFEWSGENPAFAL